jgi:hypothetical protein
MDSMQPGQLIVPHAADEPAQPPIPPAQPNPGAPDPGRANEPGEEPLPTPPPGSEPEAATLGPTSIPEPDSPWQFRQTESGAQGAIPQAQLDDITWASPEFVHHSKGVRWYGMVVAMGLVAAAVDYFVTKDWFSMGVIIFGTVALAAYGARKPREQQYALTRQGLQIGGRLYSFRDFKNFSLTEDGGSASVVFMPLRRFMPALTIHVAPEIEDRVVDFLAAVLPFEEHRGDMVEGLMRRIHF